MSTKTDLEKLPEQLWGEGYYKELEKFLKQHEGATAITYHNDLKCPIQAVYQFAPYTVVRDHFTLMEKLREAAEESPNTGSGE